MTNCVKKSDTFSRNKGVDRILSNRGSATLYYFLFLNK